LDIDEDVLLVAKEIAKRRNLSVGKVLSELARAALILCRQSACATACRSFRVVRAPAS
jgi:hypothetical protein